MLKLVAASIDPVTIVGGTPSTDMLTSGRTVRLKSGIAWKWSASVPEMVSTQLTTATTVSEVVDWKVVVCAALVPAQKVRAVGVGECNAVLIAQRCDGDTQVDDGTGRGCDGERVGCGDGVDLERRDGECRLCADFELKGQRSV